MEILQGPKKSKNNKESAKPKAELEEDKAKQQRPQRPQRPKPEATEAGLAAEDDNEEGSFSNRVVCLCLQSQFVVF